MKLDAFGYFSYIINNMKPESEKTLIDVSVIIPTFNRVDTLKNTIKHICDQDFPCENYELVIIDDCSSDGTEEYVKNIETNIRIKYIKNKCNLGRAKTRNIGIINSVGKYIHMVDDDVYAEPNLISTHYAHHQKAHNCIVTVGAILPAMNIPKTIMNSYYNRHHNWAYSEMKANRNNLPFNFCKTANIFLTRELIVKIGMFNETFSAYGGEDTELGKRLSEKGIKLLFLENAIGYHYHDQNFETFVSKEIERCTSNKIYDKLYNVGGSKYAENFFSYKYKEPNTVKNIVFNVAKFFLLTKIIYYINLSATRLLINKNLFGNIAIKLLLPILKFQIAYFKRDN